MKPQRINQNTAANQPSELEDKIASILTDFADARDHNRDVYDETGEDNYSDVLKQSKAQFKAILSTSQREAEVKQMVDRFLRWKLPEDFSPDAGITFKKPLYPSWWPVGTNLFTATQAEEMVRYMLDLPPKEQL